MKPGVVSGKRLRKRVRAARRGKLIRVARIREKGHTRVGKRISAGCCHHGRGVKPRIRR